MKKQITCESLLTNEQDGVSDISMAKITDSCLELYPAVTKTISLSLDELKAIVKEIEDYKKDPNR